MGLFSDIPIRANGDDVDSSWWNTIRSKLILFAGSAITSEVQQSITDGQSATAVAGFSLDSAVIRYARAEVLSKRVNATDERRHLQRVELMYNQIRGLWTLTWEEAGETCSASACTPTGSGLTYSVSAGGAVSVAADTMGGVHVGSIRWKIVSSFEKET